MGVFAVDGVEPSGIDKRSGILCLGEVVGELDLLVIRGVERIILASVAGPSDCFWKSGCR